MSDDATSDPGVDKSSDPSKAQKERLECDKLRAEINLAVAETKKTEKEASGLYGWRWLVSNVAVFSPAIVSIAAIAILYFSRWFEGQTKILELEGSYLRVPTLS